MPQVRLQAGLQPLGQVTALPERPAHHALPRAWRRRTEFLHPLTNPRPQRFRKSPAPA